MNSCHNMLLPYSVVWIYMSHIGFDIFNGWILIQLHQFLYHITQIQCLGDYKIVEKGSSSINMKNYNFFLPSCVEWLFLSHRGFDTLISEYWSRCINIYVSWLRFIFSVIIHQSENGSSSITVNNCHNIFLPYSVIWILLSHKSFDILLCVNIGLATPIIISCDSYSVSWWL